MFTNARVNISYKKYIYKSVFVCIHNTYNARMYKSSKFSIFVCVKFECTFRLNAVRAYVYQCKCMYTTAATAHILEYMQMQICTNVENTYNAIVNAVSLKNEGNIESKTT